MSWLYGEQTMSINEHVTVLDLQDLHITKSDYITELYT